MREDQAKQWPLLDRLKTARNTVELRIKKLDRAMEILEKEPDAEELLAIVRALNI